MESSSLATLILPGALFVIMLGVGMTLKWDDFYRILHQPRLLLLGLIGQLLLLPLVGWLVVRGFDLSPVHAVGLMILCFAPGGATSNMLTLLARGDTALSVALTAITGLIIPFSLPLLTYLSLSHWMGEQAALNFPVMQSIAQILVIAVLPAVIGTWLATRYPSLSFRLKTPVKLLSILFMVMVVVGLVRANAQNLAEQLDTLVAPVLVLSVLAIAVGVMLARVARLSPDHQCTLGIEIGIQNAGTAILVSGSLIGNPSMALVALMYGVLMNLPALVVLIYRNRDLLRAGRSVSAG